MKFSIIICTYNSVNRLPKTLESIVRQLFKDFEVVIIDGLSIDGTLDIIKEYEIRFEGKLRWISEKDEGIYDAMNKGIKLAQGEFINVIGAGDWMESDALENAVRCIEKNKDADAVYGKTRIWESDLEATRIVQTLPEMLTEYPMQHPSLFYKKALHDNFGLYNETHRIAADYDFCLKVFTVGNVKIACFNDLVSNFVMDGASSNNALKLIMENIKIRHEYDLKTHIFREFKLYLKNILHL